MKNRIIALVVGMVLLFSSLSAQRPDTLWTRTYGGVNDDGAFSIHQTNDRGFIITGYTDVPGGGGYGVYLLKTDSLGDTIWTKILGGVQSDFGRSVQQTSDGGFIVVGYTGSFGNGLRDVYMIRTDSIGNVIWTKAYGGNDYDVAFCVEQTGDGGYIVTGNTCSFGNGMADVWLLKTDSLGDTLWTQTYGKEYYDEGWSVRSTLDGGYIITGELGLMDGSYLWIIRTDSLGNVIWKKEYEQGGDSHGMSVELTSDSCFVVTGYTYNPGGSSTDIWLLKINALGDTIWTRMYGGNNTDRGFSVRETIDGGIIIAGISWSYGNGYQDIYLVRTNGQGDVLWTRTYGGAEYEGAYSISQTHDDGYVVVGYTESFGAGGNDVWLLKLESDVGIGEQPNQIALSRVLKLTTSPNPFSAVVKIQLCGASEYGSIGAPEIKIYDISGREVRHFFLYPCPERRRGASSFIPGVTWDGRDDAGKVLPPGIYFLKAGGKYVGKVVKVR
jgi:hypothetical protein